MSSLKNFSFSYKELIRSTFLVGIYSLLIISVFFFAYFLRFDFDFNYAFKYLNASPLHLSAPIIVGSNLFFLFILGQFKTSLTFFHLPDMMKIFWALTCSTLTILSACFLQIILIPRGVMLIGYMTALMLFFLFRLALRIYKECEIKDVDASRGKHHLARKNIIIIGAGDTGTMLASDLLARRNMGITPVLFLDDSKEKIGRQIMGIDVLKTPSDFTAIKRKYDISRVVLASTKFSTHRIAEITSALHKVDLEASIVPSYHDLASGKVKLSKIREIDIRDVLGRAPVDLDSEKISEMICGKVVLVTGAGGSIGSELCRQIASRNADTLIMVDHCEVQLFKAQQELIAEEYGTPIKAFVGNVTDAKRIDSLVARFKPDIIFHAAAHKHVPMMEYQPSEALKNNVLGTWTMAEAASKFGVKKFLLISTDKAVNPTNVMGATKRMAEKVVKAMQTKSGNTTQFVAVRFGNVLGSSGSVIPTFKKQIEAGGPLTLTHPDVTRYFMTIPEAVGLVLQCGSQAEGGEIFVLNMGQPVKVIDLARQMIRLSGYEPDVDIQIKIVGLRPGEKLYEELQHNDESLVKTGNPRIFGFVPKNDVKSENYDEMKAIIGNICSASDSSSVNELKRFIHSIIPEYHVQYYD